MAPTKQTCDTFQVENRSPMSDFSHTYDYFNTNLTSGCGVDYEDEKFRNTVPLDYLL